MHADASSVVDSFFFSRDPAARIPLLLLHVNLLAYALCFWLQQPVLPALSKQLGGSDLDFGNLQAALGVLGLIGSPVMGRLVDARGARLALVICQLGSGLSYALIARATSIPTLLLSTLPQVFSHAMLCSQAAVAALSTEKDRASALGRLGLSYGAGMMAGSSLGGVLSSRYGLQASAMCAAALCLACGGLCLFLLPPLKSAAGAAGGGGSLDLLAVRRVAGLPQVLDVLLVALSAGMGTAVFRAMFSMAALEDFGLTTQDLGFFISFNAGVGLATNVLLVGPVTRFLHGSERAVLTLSCVGSSLTFFALALVSHGRMVVPLSVPSTIFSTMFYTVSSARLSKCVAKEDAGTAISLSHAIRSATAIAAPVAGAYVLQQFRFPGVCVLSGACTGLGALFLYLRPSVSATADVASGGAVGVVAGAGTDRGVKEEKSHIS